MPTRQKRVWWVCEGIALWILMATAAHALMLAMSLEQLVAESDMVVAGRVMEVRSFWTTDHKSIVTRANVALSEVIAGGEVKKPVVVVEYPGGEVDDIGLKVSDVAPLKTGENVVLFLRRMNSPAGDVVSAGGVQVMQIVGEAQGKYSVAEGMAVKGDFTVAGPNAKVQYTVPVEDLKREVRKLWASK